LDVWSRPERLRDPNAACEARLPGTAGACPERSRRVPPAGLADLGQNPERGRQDSGTRANSPFLSRLGALRAKTTKNGLRCRKEKMRCRRKKERCRRKKERYRRKKERYRRKKERCRRKKERYRRKKERCRRKKERCRRKKVRRRKEKERYRRKKERCRRKKERCRRKKVRRRKEKVRCRKRCFRRFPSGSRRYLTLRRAGDQAYTSVTAGIIRSTAPGFQPGEHEHPPSFAARFQRAKPASLA
jgi:hypothetical protein